MQAPDDARRRILLLFSLGIAAPSFLLGYLALRGIQNDRALVEQEQRNEHRLIAARIGESLDERIGLIEGSLDRVTEGLRHLDLDNADFDDTDLDNTDLDNALEPLDDLRIREPAIQGVFFLLRDGSVRLVSPRPLFSDTQGGGSSATSDLSRVPSDLEAGRVLELRDGNYEGALAAYREVASQASDPRLRGEALGAIARVQAKSGSVREAVDSYRSLLRDFGSLRMVGGMPFGIVARLELASSLFAVSDTLAAAQTWVELYRGLLRAEWPLTPAEFDFFTGRIRASVEEGLPGRVTSGALVAYRDTLLALAEEEAAGRSVTGEHLAFEQQASQMLPQRLAAAPNGPSARWRRVTLEAGDRTYHLSVQQSVDRSGVDQAGSWGMLLDRETLIESLLRPAIEAHAATGVASWIVRGRNGEPVLVSEASPEGPATITAGLASDFLGWTLELRQPDPRLVETLLTSRRGVYFYAFLLLTGILAFGLTLTARSVTHQLELARLKSDFVSTVSHEFKSPLTAIRQLAEMLQSGRVASEEKRAHYYDVLLEQSERLSVLVDNVLDLARMDEGRYELERARIDVGALLEEIVKSVEHRVRHEGFRIRSEIEDPAPSLTLDAAAVTQATTNMIDNGVKYSGDSKEVVVRGFSRNGHFVITVQDFGVGLDDDEAAKVFERFYRGGSELTRTVKGTGLGLALVKQIAEAHGGSVAVESTLGSGSTFSIRLPLDSAAESARG